MKSSARDLQHATETPQRVAALVESIKTLEGGGFPVRRPFPIRDLSQMDPFLLLAGLPLREPVARYGPFVMNTEEEIRQALGDYREGRMGRIPVQPAIVRGSR